MNLVKFSEFLNEDIKIPILDVVIGYDGVVYNGENGTILTKGSIQFRKIKGSDGRTLNRNVGIKGDDGRDYPIGINKNGDLEAVYPDVNDVYALDSKDGNRIRVPDNIYNSKFKSHYWKITDDYSFLIPIIATGWVNVKVDMEIIKRVRRYSKGIGSNNRGFNSFISKLSDLQKISLGNIGTARNRATIQKEMSVIILLHYINEIKNFFTPSSSGFLFESFLGGLIPNAKVKEDNSKVDIFADGKKYQVKLVTELDTTVPVAYDNGSPLDYYLICLKYVDRIEIYVLDGIDEESENYFRTFLTTTESNFSLTDLKLAEIDKKFTISLINIEQKIRNITKDIKGILDNLYGELSKFQYNVETIITGFDEKGSVIDADGFEHYFDESIRNLGRMGNELNNLMQDVVRNPNANQQARALNRINKINNN